ncbi:UNVERIFIED_CONTAM: LOB domain-containing protein 38 [Sesamum radiatum]|uniref:LOB domain-containing protein 38 n=1 Tax=Sesamum radiatum TaxID=300843 RepID=A0AAW2QG85_SESRA
MSCNGCRVLRRGCSDQCILRPCLEWIESPQAQGNATLFVSKFFGRSDLMSFIAAVPETKRPALFQSLLFESCGRTVNPVNGAVGLLSTGNWQICEAAVETVLAGGVLRPISIGILAPNSDEASAWGNHQSSSKHKGVVHGSMGGGSRNCMEKTASFGSGISEVSRENRVKGVGSKEPKLLNLFA